jgi:hypothetical protein
MVACEKDLGRDHFVTELYEIKPCTWAAEFNLKNVDRVRYKSH